jgi:integrase
LVSIVDPVTVEALRRWADDQADERSAWGIAYTDSGATFTAEDGQPFHADRVAQAFDRFVEAAPVPTLRFHDLRHTHASLLLAQGVPVVDVAYRLGDSPETILSTYAHFIPGQGKRAIEAFSYMVDGEQDA